jgi:hypothetical protein
MFRLHFAFGRTLGAIRMFFEQPRRKELKNPLSSTVVGGFNVIPSGSTGLVCQCHRRYREAGRHTVEHIFAEEVIETTNSLARDPTLGGGVGCQANRTATAAQ